MPSTKNCKTQKNLKFQTWRLMKLSPFLIPPPQLAFQKKMFTVSKSHSKCFTSHRPYHLHHSKTLTTLQQECLQKLAKLHLRPNLNVSLITSNPHFMPVARANTFAELWQFNLLCEINKRNKRNKNKKIFFILSSYYYPNILPTIFNAI